MEATHPHPSSHDDLMTNVLTGVFLATAVVFRLTMVNPHLLYDLLFKGLSLVPVVMAIVVNYPKFSQRVSTWYKSRKKTSKKRASK